MEKTLLDSIRTFYKGSGENDKQGVGSLKPYFDEMNQTSWCPIQQSYPHHTVVTFHCRALFMLMMKICCTLCHCHIPWSQNGVVPLGLSGPPFKEGNLGYEPTRDLPARAPEVIWV